MTRLKAEVEKVKEEHKRQIAQVTESASSEIVDAKAEFAEKERLLLAEIDTLKQEKQTLEDSNKLQKEQAEMVAKKMESWYKLVEDLNRKMEG